MRPNVRERLRTWLIGSLIFASTGAGRELEAQMKVELTPYLGVYVPVFDLVNEFEPVLNTNMSIEGETALLIGGRVGVWVSDRLGLEGALGYAGSEVSAKAEGFGSTEAEAHLLLMSGRAVVGLSPPSRANRLHLLLGLSVVNHGGEAFENADGRTDLGAILGAGTRMALTPSIDLRIDLEDYVYVAAFGDSTGDETDSKLQNDFVLSLGIAIPLVR